MPNNQWTNTSGGTWNVATNWSTDGVPNATTDVVIDLGNSYTIAVPAAQYYAGSITITNPNAELLVSGNGSQLSVTSGISNGGDILASQGGQVVVGGTVINSGTFGLDNSASVTVGGDFINSASGILNEDSEIFAGGSDLTISGTLYNVGTVGIGFAYGDGTVLSLGGLVNSSGASFQVSNASTVELGSQFTDNAGTFELTNGSVFDDTAANTIGNSFVNSGTFGVQNNETLTVDGDFTNIGTLGEDSEIFDGGSNLTISGTLYNVGTTVIGLAYGAGTVLSLGGLDNQFGASFEVSDASTVVLGSQFTDNAGTFELTNGAVLDDTAANTIDNSFTNSGTFAMQDSVTLTVDGDFNNAGTLDEDSEIFAEGSDLMISGTLNNSGTAVIGDPFGYGGDTTLSAGGLTNGRGDNISVNGTPDEAVTFQVNGGGTNLGAIQLSGDVVFNGGSVSTETGGTVDAGSGSTAINGIIGPDGNETVSAGGTASDTEIAGGTLLVSSGGVASGSISFVASGGGVLAIGNPNLGALLPDATISGFAIGDTIDLTAIPFDSTGSATLGPDNVLAVNEGDSSYQLDFDPTQSFTGEEFVLSSDLVSGTDINLTTTSSPPPQSANSEWINTSGGTWNVAANWSTDGVPNATTDVVVDLGDTYTIAVPAAQYYASSITITNPNAELLVNGNGSQLSVTSGVSNGGDILASQGGQLTVGGSFANYGTLDEDSEIFQGGSDLTISGVLNNSGTAVIGDPFGYGSGTVLNLGGLDNPSGASFEANNSATVVLGTLFTSNGGTFELTDGAILDNTASNTIGGDFTNTGTFALQGNVTLTVSGDFANEGTLDEDSEIFQGGSDLTIDGTLNNSGTAVIGDPFGYGSGTVLNLGGLDNPSGASFEANNSATVVLGTLFTSNGGTFELTDGAILDNNAPNTIGGDFTNTGTFALQGNVTLTVSGDFANEGTLDEDSEIFQADSHLTIDGALTNDGTVQEGNTDPNNTEGWYAVQATLGELDNAAGATVIVDGTGISEKSTGDVSLDVMSGGTNFGAIELDGYTVFNAGSEVTESGGTVTAGGGSYLLYGIIGPGGNQTVDSSGVATNVTINGGVEQVLAGGFDQNATINSGGTEIVYGSATLMTINSGGTEIVEAGGFAGDPVINGGTLEVISNGVVDGDAGIIGNLSDVSFASGVSGGTLELGDGQQGNLLPSAVIYGMAPGDTVDLTAVAFTGSGTATLVNNVLTVSEGGGTYTLQLNPSQNFGGKQFVLSNDGSGGTDITIASASSPPTPNTLTIGSTESLTVSGSNDILNVVSGVNDGGDMAVINGGTVTVSGDFTNMGTLDVDSGFGDAGSILKISGTLTNEGTVQEGNTAPNLWGGTQITVNELNNAPGATVIVDGSSPGFTGLDAFNVLSGTNSGDIEVTGGNTILFNAGSEVTEDSGTVTVGGGAYFENGIIGSGGNLTLDSGGVDIDVTVSGGIEQVLAGSLDQETTVDNGGTEYVYGSATLTTINGGGTEIVEAGGYVDDPVINGGTLEVTSAGVVGGTDFGTDGVTFSLASGGTLKLDGSQPGNLLPSGAISGMEPGDTVDLTTVAFTGSGTVSMGPGNVLTVSEGGTFTLPFDLSQNFGGEEFVLSNDGFGGTDITIALPPPPPPPPPLAMSISMPPATLLPQGVPTLIGGVSITDSNSGGNVTATISATGLLSASDASGSATITGAGTTILTISGSLASVNADLTTLTDDYEATGSSGMADTITVNAQDNLGGYAAPAATVGDVTDNAGTYVQIPANSTGDIGMVGSDDEPINVNGGATNGIIFTVGNGNDAVVVGNNDFIPTVGNGNDQIFVTGSDNWMDVGSGTDIVYVSGSNNDLYFGGGGADTIVVGGGVANLIAGSSDGTLTVIAEAPAATPARFGFEDINPNSFLMYVGADGGAPTTVAGVLADLTQVQGGNNPMTDLTYGNHTYVFNDVAKSQLSASNFSVAAG